MGKTLIISDVSFYNNALASIITPPVISFQGRVASISCDTEGARIYYTLDGTNPTKESTLYSEPFSLTEDTVIKAISALDVPELDTVISSVVTENYESEVLVTGWTLGVHGGSVSDGVSGKTSSSSKRAKVVLTDYRVEDYQSIKLDLTTYKYVAVYRNANKQIITGTRYSWETSNLNFKTAFPAPAEAVYVEFSIAGVVDIDPMHTNANVINLRLVK